MNITTDLHSSSSYDQNYLNWKEWGAGKFGLLPLQMRSYYSAEMRRTGLNLRSGLDVLEIGFGNGSFLAFARARGWVITGTELNPALTEAAHAQGYAVHPDGDLETLPHAGFDLIAAFDVMEHIPQTQIPSFLEQVLRLLKPDGVFLARFPNGDSPFGMINQNGDITHVTVIGSEKARYFANNARARIVYLGGEALLGGKALPENGWGIPAAIYLALVLPLRFLINLAINVIFFARFKVAYCSTNLVMILRPGRPAIPPAG